MESEAVQKAVELAKRFEGLCLRPYLCPAGVPTIGWGATRYPGGLRVSLRDPAITRERAETLLHEEMRECLRETVRLCPGLPDWGVDPLAAITDFTFNLGWPRLAASTLRRRIAADDSLAAKQELMKWVYGGGRRLRGLELRRLAECELIG